MIKPGPDMDRMVAEKVMGWSDYMCADAYLMSDTRIRNTHPSCANEAAFNPSTNIAHAWEVVERVTRVCGAKCPYNGMPIATVFSDLFQRRDMWAENASDAAFHICRFALMAVGAIEVR